MINSFNNVTNLEEYQRDPQGDLDHDELMKVFKVG